MDMKGEVHMLNHNIERLVCAKAMNHKKHILVFILFITLILLSTSAFADDHGNTTATATNVNVGSITHGAIETGGDLDKI